MKVSGDVRSGVNMKFTSQSFFLGMEAAYISQGDYRVKGQAAFGQGNEWPG